MTKFLAKDVKMTMEGCRLVTTVHGSMHFARQILDMVMTSHKTKIGFVYEYPNEVYGVYIEKD